MARLADYVINRISQEGVDTVFMVTGRGILYLTDALAANKSIKAVSTLHEQGASYAALAYAQSRNDIGVCLVSTGCAATNAVTAALCAWQDDIPCVFISGQHMLNETTAFTGLNIRTFGSQEANIVDVVKSITKYSVMIKDPNDIKFELEKAIYIARNGRKGPVWIDIPLDIQNARVEKDNLKPFEVLETKDRSLKEDVLVEAKNVAEELKNAKRPIIMIGSGIRSSNAEALIKELVEKTHIPLVFSPSACDIYGAGNKLSIGAVGSLGASRAGNFAVQNCDYFLAIGSRLSSQTTGEDFSSFARAAKITVVDIDKSEHTKKGVNIYKFINADASIFLEPLINNVQTEPLSAWVKKCLHWKKLFSVFGEDFVQEELKNDKIDLYLFADTISKIISEKTTVITDAGFEELIIPATIKFKPGQRCLFLPSQGAMGYALPAAIGAAYAGKNDIIMIVGDGSIMMNIQELETLVFHKIPAKIFVINNDMYAVIRKRQKDLFRRRTIGNDPSDGLPSPDFKKISDAFGLNYLKISKISELAERLKEALSMTGPVLCEVRCISDQKYFHTAYGKNEKNRLIKRPIEDMSPFLDRELIKNEMIIDPVNL